jgi:hypothetical protein
MLGRKECVARMARVGLGEGSALEFGVGILRVRAEELCISVKEVVVL